MRFFRRRSNQSPSSPDVQPLADHGLLFTFGDCIDAALSRRIVRLAGEITNRALPGVVDVIPSYTTLLLIIDPNVADRDELRATVLGAWVMVARRDGDDATAREVVIPVAYGGEHGPDLDDVARVTGLSPEDVIERHRTGSYQVGAIGFAPGFAFLIGLPPELAVPRRSTPRTLVPAGSVGIGGSQTGIYSLPTPGGWSLIGRTQLTMFDPDREPPSLLQAGDRVRFEQVEAEPLVPPQSKASKACAGSFHDAIEVVTPGLQTTIQDLGRPGYGQMGVAPGGAVDRAALITGNRLVDNVDNAAGLEITLLGPTLRFLKPGRISLTGGELGATLNGFPMPAGAVRVVGPGDELRFGPHHFTRGARAYLCVAGGIEVPARMGSCSTDLNARFGGLDGRALLAGDRLRTGHQRRLSDARVPGRVASITSVFRVVEGPHRGRFGDDAWRAFLSEEFTISSSSNRMGIRLDGPRLVPEGGADIISEGMVTGAIQVTGDGQPIVMLPARATIGGYPKIAVVVAADLDALGQLRPGDRIRFEAAPLSE